MHLVIQVSNGRVSGVSEHRGADSGQAAITEAVTICNENGSDNNDEIRAELLENDEYIPNYHTLVNRPNKHPEWSVAVYEVV